MTVILVNEWGCSGIFLIFSKQIPIHRPNPLFQKYPPAPSHQNSPARSKKGTENIKKTYLIFMQIIKSHTFVHQLGWGNK